MASFAVRKELNGAVGTQLVAHPAAGAPLFVDFREDTVDLDIFSPIRLDWLTRKDEYLRRGERAAAK